MKIRPMWRLTTGKTLVLSAVMTVAIAGTAYANTVSVTVKTPGATLGPAAAFTEISTHADCSSGLIAGGGINQAIGTGTSSNGNHVNGTSPSPDGTTEYTGSTGVVGTDVTHWLGSGGSGGSVTTTDFTGPASVGDHLNGSYPSDSGGSPVGDGTTTAAYWTAYAHQGPQLARHPFRRLGALRQRRHLIHTCPERHLQLP